MKILLVIAILFISNITDAQILYSDWTLPTNEGMQSIEVEGNLSYQSNALTNNFASKFIFGGNISSEVIANNESQLGSSNLVGLETKGSLKYTNTKDTILKSGKWGYAVRFEHQQYANASFQKDLFHAIFVGNADKLGEKLSFGPTQINNLIFQKLGFGLVHKKSNSEIGVNIVKGQSYQRFNIESGYLFTASDVSYLDLNIHGDLMRSDSYGNKLGTLNGFGGVINAQWNIPLSKKEKELGMLKIKVDNLGVIAWSRNSNTTSIDTSFQFNGVEINNILNTSVSSTENLNTVIDSLIPSAETKPFYTMMPTILSISKEPLESKIKKFQSILGIRYVLNINYKPLIYGGAYYRFNEKVAASSLLMYGGYGIVNLGLRGNFNFSEKIAFYLASQNAIGTFSKKGKGFNLNLGLQCKF